MSRRPLQMAALLLFVCVVTAEAQLSVVSTTDGRLRDAEKSELLAFKGSWKKNARCAFLRSWQEADDTEPCSMESASSFTKGWTGVMCTGEHGRVSIIDLQFADVGGDIKYLGQLTDLRVINLSQNLGVRGDIGELATLTELTFLGLYETSVHGEPSSLRALQRLGTDWIAPEGPKTCITAGSGDGFKQCEQDPVSGNLYLANTNVAGHVEQLHQIVGLGGDWARHADSYTRCTSYSSNCRTKGLRLVANATHVAGRDECACCAGTQMVRNETNGKCISRP